MNRLLLGFACLFLVLSSCADSYKGKYILKTGAGGLANATYRLKIGKDTAEIKTKGRGCVIGKYRYHYSGSPNLVGDSLLVLTNTFVDSIPVVDSMVIRFRDGKCYLRKSDLELKKKCYFAWKLGLVRRHQLRF